MPETIFYDIPESANGARSIDLIYPIQFNLLRESLCNDDSSLWRCSCHKCDCWNPEATIRVSHNENDEYFETHRLNHCVDCLEFCLTKYR